MLRAHHLCSKIFILFVFPSDLELTLATFSTPFNLSSLVTADLTRSAYFNHDKHEATPKQNPHCLCLLTCFFSPLFLFISLSHYWIPEVVVSESGSVPFSFPIHLVTLLSLKTLFLERCLGMIVLSLTLKDVSGALTIFTPVSPVISQ